MSSLIKIVTGLNPQRQKKNQPRKLEVIQMNDTQQYINIKKNINWKKDVMPIIKERLNLWSSQQITPTLRTLFYTLVSLNVLENTPERYGYLSKFTARARENSQIGVKKIDDDGYIY